VQRTGWLKYAPLTRDQVRKACLFAEAWVRQTTWKDVEDLIHGTAWMIGEQLSRPINAMLVGMHDIDDMPVVRVQIGEMVHHIAFRDTRMVENNTAELMLGEARIEQLVEQRMQAAKDRKRAVVEKLGAKVKVP
jgi:hypothetical protein